MNSSRSYLKQLSNLKFDNLALRALPVDKSMLPGSRKVPGACFSLVNPTPVENPKLVALSRSALHLLDIDETTATDEELAEYFSGNKKLDGSESAAHCYCGHQFGAFSGQLGDGAAIYLGEIINSKKEKWEIQLKGAGPTPYSRSSDGRKVLRSSIREFLCSEAMHHLGVPTTRAGTLVTSETLILRDMFYDGRARREKCSLVLRIAPTFLRFGSFEIFKAEDPMTGRAGPSVGRDDILHQMLDYAISNFFPHISQLHLDSREDRYLKFYEEVCIKTARLVALWQSIGFCHSVLNTDNMSILGLTIDYGPFGFLDRYDPDFVCNTTDENGRYSYRKQPEICHWNLKKFAEALNHALPLQKSLHTLNDVYYKEFNSFYLDKMRKKLGLVTKELEEDEALIKSLLETMEDTYADYTNTFRHLNMVTLPQTPGHAGTQNKALGLLLEGCAELDAVKTFSKPSFDMQQMVQLRQMAEQNPQFLQLIGGLDGPIKREIEKAEKFEHISELTKEALLSSNRDKWTTWLGRYKERLEKECDSSTDFSAFNQARKQIMNANNPKYILRNYIAQNAIEEAEKGNFIEVHNILRRLEQPYEEGLNCPQFGFNNILYNSVPPTAAMSLRVS